MAHRSIAALVAGATLLLTAPAAHAELVYVKKPNSPRPQVWVAQDDGTGALKLGTGIQPAVSPDGNWVAWRAFGSRESVQLAHSSGGRTRRVVRSQSIGELRFSPDSTTLAAALNGRLLVHDLATGVSTTAARGNIRGFSFSPDSLQVVYGTSGTDDALDAPSDLYRFTLAGYRKARVTRDRKSLHPLWGPDGNIYHDRQIRRPGDAPTYNLFSIHPDGGSLRRITSLKIPHLLSGLVPLDISTDAKRLLAEFTGQDTAFGFAVSLPSGNTRALSKKAETGFVATDVSADGRLVLGMTGGPDPASAHDVVTLPWRGGTPTVLVRGATTPHWTR